jgi:polysaccharide biosynthesis transport protein
MSGKLPTLTVAAPMETEPPLLSVGEQQEIGMSMAQLFAIIWAYRKISILITGVLIVLFAGVIKLLPKSYDATATIIVNYESNDPLGVSAFPTGFMDSYIATQIQVMQSSSVIVPVIDELDLTKRKEFTAGFNGQGKLIDWVKAQLLKNLAFRHPGGTQLIYVNATARDAVDSALIANTVAKVYLSQQTDRLNKPASQRAERYAEQLSELKEKVNAAQEKVTEFRQEYGLTDLISTSADTEVSTLNLLESRYQEALNNERTAMVSQATEQDVSKAASQSMVIQGLRSNLANLRAQMAEYQTTYGPKHPKVIELQSQIDSTSATLNNEMKALSTNSNADLTTVRDLATKLKSATELQRQKVLALRRQQDEGAKLLLELDSAQAVYKRALDGYDKVFAAASGLGSNVSLMDGAEVPVKSTKPNKLKLMIVALGAAFFFGFAGPFAYDFLLHRRVRCRDDVERDLGMPVLAEFNKIPSQAEVA